jgi:WS/DGAT/MGAT family acyltransferase
MYLIEGLQGGRVALLWKIHHCMMDGESGAGLVEVLFDIAPEPGDRPLLPVTDTEECSQPSLFEMVRNGMSNSQARTRAFARNFGGAVSAVIEAQRSEGEAVTAPPTSINGKISGRRAIAWSSVPLEHLLEIKKELGVSVNDVILAITGGAMRRYLEERNELPEESLYASMPVSTRKKGDKTVGNQVRDASVLWGTNVEDPVERVLQINAASKKVKRQIAEGGPSFIQGAAESLIPGVTRLFMSASAAAADSLPLPANCVVSNVRMTDFPMYIAGAKIVGMVPMSMLAPTQGANITVVTYDGELHFGVIVDPKLCDAPWHVAEGIAKSLVDLQMAMEGSDVEAVA